MKEASRNKFMLCFRPVDAAGDGSVRYISARSSDGCSTRPVQCARKPSLSRAVRAVLYQNIWGKRARDKKGSRSSTRTSSSTSEESSSLPSSPSSYASSSDDNKTENLGNQETKPKPVSESRIGKDQSFVTSGALLFLISLATTVMWGRVCAILFTLIWIYLLSLPKEVSGERPNSSPVTKRSKKTRSGESYSRKRVIMEGLLDRNHRRAEIERI